MLRNAAEKKTKQNKKTQGQTDRWSSMTKDKSITAGVAHTDQSEILLLVVVSKTNIYCGQKQKANTNMAKWSPQHF